MFKLIETLKEAKTQRCSVGRTPQPDADFENEVGATSNGI